MKILKDTPFLLPAIFAFLFLFHSASNAAVPIPAAPKVSAKNYILVDANSGHVLAEKRPTSKLSLRVSPK